MAISSSTARNQFSDSLNRVAYRGERIVLERRGKPIAALVPVEDLALLEELEDRRDAEEGARALREFRDSGEEGIPLAVVKRELGIK